MSFTNINFIIRFLPVFLCVYYLADYRLRPFVLFGGSIYFYAIGNWKFCLMLLGLTIFNYFLSLTMSRQRDPVKRLLIFLFLVLLNVGILIFFKYFSGTLPMGISFYTFMNLSYFIDVSTGKAKMLGFIYYANYIMMFPKIIEGPIVRYVDFRTQLTKKHSFRMANIEYGLESFIVGMGFKLVIADQMCSLWNSINMNGYKNISTPLAWLGAAAYSTELFFDFQGYTLMAIGVARMLGYDLPDNFLHPYRSKTVAEFYRRWHATLGNWFKNYIYFPLGGSRAGDLITVRNLIVVWVLTGIWHGSQLNFILWGLVLVTFIIMEKFLYGKFLDAHPVVGTVYIWTVIPVTWVIFAITDFQKLGIYLARMFPFFGIGATTHTDDWIIYGKQYGWLMLLGFLVSLPIADTIWKRYRKSVPMKILLFALFWFCVYRASVSSQNPFMYGGF